MKSNEGHSYLPEATLLKWLGEIATKHTSSLLRTTAMEMKKDEQELRQEFYRRAQKVARVRLVDNMFY
jgi:hypothetical protein